MLNKTRLLTPGPTPIPEPVRLALAQDMIHHRKSQFVEIMHNIQTKLKILFGTSQPVLPLSCSGTGAMTAAVYSLFVPGDKVGIIIGGKFGQRWQEIATSRHLRCEVLNIPWGTTIPPDVVAEFLRQHRDMRGLLVQQCETSTGILMPIREIGALTRNSSILLVVDGISGVGISPAPMEEWGLDCLLTGSQKGLMLPPGLALLALSGKAWECAQTIEPGCYYFNLPAEKKNIERGQTNFTSPVNLLVALDIALDFILKDGLDSVYRKQWSLTALVRRGLAALDLRLMAESNFAWGITSAYLPDNVDGVELLAQMASRFGIVMAGGQDRLKGKIVRFGHMGWVDWADCIAGLCALRSALLEQNARINSGEDFIQAAMSAYGKALQTYA